MKSPTAYDDQGRKFDAEATSTSGGQRTTPRLDSRAQLVVDEYNAFERSRLHVNEN